MEPGLQLELIQHETLWENCQTHFAGVRVAARNILNCCLADRSTNARFGEKIVST
jgi:hypothetical protein